MREVAVICFTEKGKELAIKLQCHKEAEEYSFSLYAKYDGFSEDATKGKIVAIEEKLSEWTLRMQHNRMPLIFIGALGIAVRSIARGLTDKLTDAPVVVMDELGRHVIPVVSGHVGGANALAVYVANLLGAEPVITTATDLEESFSVDLFAKENQLEIYNREGIRKVSAKALEGKPVRISIEDFPPEETDVLISGQEGMLGKCDLLLCPRTYAVGIGCKKGTSFALLQNFFEKVLSENNIRISQVGAIASIDLKAEEEGILQLSRYYKLPFITFTAKLLEKARGSFEESDFVRETTGVGNVCERAAMLLTGNRGRIIQKKYAEEGMTLAIAKME